MRIFVGYGYRPEEKELSDQVLAMLSHLGVTIEDGREIGGSIDEEVSARILSCDGYVGLCARRGQRADGRFDTSDYVQQEMHIALIARPRKLVAQVLEDGVVAVGGYGKNFQQIPFQHEAPADLLVALGRHVREWVRGEVFVRILPDRLAQDVARAGGGVCRYRIYEKSTEIWCSKAPIVHDGGGMFTTLLKFVPGTRAQLEIDVGGRTWASLHTPYSEPFSQIGLS